MLKFKFSSDQSKNGTSYESVGSHFTTLVSEKANEEMKENPLAGKKVLAIFNADIEKRKRDMQEKGTANFPKADFLALLEVLQADAIDLGAVERSFGGRLVKKILGKNVALAWVAFRKAKNYDVIYSDGEPNGIPLALMLKLTGSKKKVSMIAHILTPFKKAIFFRWFGLSSNIGVIFLHSTHQYNSAINILRISPKKLRLLPYQVDPNFWSPDAIKAPPSEEPYIVSAGLEFRDYGTLIEAMKGLPLKLKIGAASHWSRRKDSALSGDLPENVEIASYNYSQLRELYAGSQFVVVALQDVEFQAGITVILEAMAMGKSVIVTRSVGQQDVINDRRRLTRGQSQRTASATFPKLFNANSADKQTGFYVNPGEPEELRKAIKFLLQKPDKAVEMGRNARAVLEEVMTLDLFCHRIQQGLAEVAE